MRTLFLRANLVQDEQCSYARYPLCSHDMPQPPSLYVLCKDGHIGEEYLEEIGKKVDKFKEPPSQKSTRALPAPMEAPVKKRGGRRYVCTKSCGIGCVNRQRKRIENHQFVIRNFGE